MSDKIQIFKNKDFGELEVLLIDDKPYFPATESAKILSYKDPINAIKQHCKGVVKHHILTNGGNQEKNFISEGDLYRLIIRSKLPTAVKFEEWIFDEVLPSIRKHGAYITNNTLDDLLNNPDTAIRLFTTLKEEREKKEALERQIEIIAPKARYYDLILQCDTAIPITVIAKDYGMSAASLNKLLYDLKVQYKVDGIWVLYQKHSNQGYTVTQTHYVNNEQMAITHTYWTQRGRRFIYDLLKYWNILPEIERGEECICLT
ncbi:MAG: phage antirepressor KilAC domain-containing protein [Oscillospiraceae bacterium]|nr:phage antirepressor KilAC domain-containing protein [Oscillospiraceae bacterium]